jgi:hypothetical protein
VGLNALGPVGKIISTAGNIVNAGYGINNMVKDMKKAPPKPPPGVIIH